MLRVTTVGVSLELSTGAWSGQPIGVVHASAPPQWQQPQRCWMVGWLVLRLHGLQCGKTTNEGYSHRLTRNARNWEWIKVKMIEIMTRDLPGVDFLLPKPPNSVVVLHI